MLEITYARNWYEFHYIGEYRHGNWYLSLTVTRPDGYIDATRGYIRELVDEETIDRIFDR